jgi:hypothetical protein
VEVEEVVEEEEQEELEEEEEVEESEQEEEEVEESEQEEEEVGELEQEEEGAFYTIFTGTRDYNPPLNLKFVMTTARSSHCISLAPASSPDLLAAINRLLPQVGEEGISRCAHALLSLQLSPTAAALSQQQLDRIVQAPGTRIYIAREQRGDSGSSSDIIGMLTLCIFSTPIGTRATIGRRLCFTASCPHLSPTHSHPSEDLVVDSCARGCGVGKSLVHTALAAAGAALLPFHC